MVRLLLDRIHVRAWNDRRDESMSVWRRTASAVMARRLKQYREGDRVRILRGSLAGQIMTVRESSNDWVTFKETPKREVMSKGNVEPEGGFTPEEMNQAERVARKS